MKLSENEYQNYTAILRAELIPAMGCTEPIAIAYAAAEARRLLGVYWSSFLVTLCSEIMLYIETPLVSYSYSLNEVSHSCTS